MYMYDYVYVLFKNALICTSPILVDHAHDPLCIVVVAVAVDLAHIDGIGGTGATGGTGGTGATGATGGTGGTGLFFGTGFLWSKQRNLSCPH